MIEICKKYDLIKLKSDYLGMDIFFYNKKQNIIYYITHNKYRLLKPSYDIEQHIREYNKLPLIKN